MIVSEKYCVTISETDERFECRGDEVVLEAMLRSRSGHIRQGCFGGGCGICRMKITNGDYKKVKRMSRAHVSQADEEAGIVLLCCIQPRGDLIVSNIACETCD